jgi:hypothetical protein
LPQRTAQGRIVTESIIAKRLSGIPPCRFGKALMLKLDDSPDHFQVYTGQVRVGTIYKTSGNPTGNQWFWGLNGVENEHSRMPRPNLPPPGALGSRLPG